MGEALTIFTEQQSLFRFVSSLVWLLSGRESKADLKEVFLLLDRFRSDMCDEATTIEWDSSERKRSIIIMIQDTDVSDGAP